jgi:hypothetical protein
VGKPETYFDDLPAVMKEASALPGEEALYEQIAAVFELPRRTRSQDGISGFFCQSTG